MTAAERAQAARTATDLVRALDRHYLGPPGSRDADSYARWCELADPHGRRVDYLALPLWASRGWQLDGHEIKVSRSDWLRELNRANKSDTWWQACNRWWLVVADRTIVQDGELPPGWGLMVPPATARGRAMQVIVPAEERRHVIPAWLLTTLVKRDRLRTTQKIYDARQKGLTEGRREEAARQEKTTERAALTSVQAERLELLNVIEQHAGAEIRHYVGPNRDGVEARTLGVALKVAAALRGRNGFGELSGTIRSLADYCAAVAAAGDQLRGASAELHQLLDQAVPS